jgi:hypothetical protein
MIKRLLHDKIGQPVLNLLKQGISPENMSLSIAFGAIIGILPILGSTTRICTAIATVLRLNLPAIQLSFSTGFLGKHRFLFRNGYLRRRCLAHRMHTAVCWYLCDTPRGIEKIRAHSPKSRVIEIISPAGCQKACYRLRWHIMR